MPLPYSHSKKLKREINDIGAQLYRKHTESRAVLDSKIKSSLEEETIKYIEPYIETLKILREKGLISCEESWRGFVLEFKSNSLLAELGKIKSEKLKAMLGNTSYTMNLDLLEVVNNKSLIEDLKKRHEDNGRMIGILKNAESLADQLVNSYGTVKYMLTQFPELKEIFNDEYDPTWKPNPNYKVKPRSAFENNNAFILLFGEAAMFGIKP